MIRRITTPDVSFDTRSSTKVEAMRRLPLLGRRTSLVVALHAFGVMACGSSEAPTPPPTTVAPPTPPPVAAPGVLVPGAPASTVAVPAVPAFTFTLDHAAELQLDAMGTPDVQLLLLSGESVVTQDSDSGAGTDAQIVTFLAPGTYEARVSEWRGRALDARVSVTELPAMTPAGALVAGTPSTVAVVAGDTRRAASAELSLEIATAGSYRIDVMSAAGAGRDAELLLHRDNAVIAEDSDSGDENNAQLVRTLEPGSYRVRVRDWMNREASLTVTLSPG
jgi:hypothetical protein